MKKLVKYLRGWARVSIRGSFPERLLNLCAQRGVEFWAVDWREEDIVLLTVRLRGLPALHSLAEKVGCEVTILRREGLPELAAAFRRRYAFLLGLALSLCAVTVLSLFVLTVEVTGNETLSEAVILQHLQRFGVRPGAFGPGLDRRQIEQEILRDLPELSWMSINLSGTRVEVSVREREEAPKRVNESGLYHIVAESDGIITRVEPEQGDAIARVGDIVLAGETLISGTVTLEPPQYSDLPERTYQTHARGRVWARTWRTVTAVIPDTADVKSCTGREVRVVSINFFGNRAEIFGNSSNLVEGYDKISRVYQVVLPGGERLPLWLSVDTFRAYTVGKSEVQRDAAADVLKEQLARYLEQLAGEDGSVLDIQYTTRITNGVIRVTAASECMEEIGREVPGH